MTEFSELWYELRKVHMRLPVQESDPHAIEALKRELAKIKKYGVPVDVCKCRLWNKRCTNTYVCLAYGGIFDHVQMYKKDGVLTYISEPYANAIKDTVEINKFAKLYGLTVTIAPEESSWFPGATTAIIFQSGNRETPRTCRSCIQNFRGICDIFNINVQKPNPYKWCTEWRPQWK